MITVEELGRQLQLLEPQKNPARLAFYNFVRNFLPGSTPFTQEMLDAFYDRALILNHWQTNKKALGETLRDDLAKISAQRSFAFSLDQVLHSCDIQAITFERLSDFQALLDKGSKRLESSGEKVRLFELRQGHTHTPHEVLSVRLTKTGAVIVEIYPNVAMIVDGELQLVRPHSRLTYTLELDFNPQVDQILATSLMRVARFRGTGHKITGQFIQGVHFASSESFDKPLNEIAEVNQAVKRIERFYVNPVSDPYYQDLYEKVVRQSEPNSP